MLNFFISDNLHYIDLANKNSNISSIITSKKLFNRVDTRKGLIIAKDPRKKFYSIHEKFSQNLRKNFRDFIGKNTYIHSSAQVSDKTYIGNNVIISENVIIKDYSIIKDNVFIDCNTVIGNEGMLYYKDHESNKRIKHFGGVIIHPNSNILSNTSIVKSVFPNSYTSIGKNCQVGIGTTVSHDCNIGNNCIISGNSYIARNVKLCKNVFLGTSCFIKENLELKENVNVMAGSVVINNISKDQQVSGNFAKDHISRISNFVKK